MSDRRKAPSVETIDMTMRFGEFTALDAVSIKVEAGSFHALLGENGAGKSTLVKCMMGFYKATDGQMTVNDKEVEIDDPKDAYDLGLGMVYQHFTLVPSLTAAENLVIARADTPAVIDWRKERQRLDSFMASMPFSVPLNRPVHSLAAGEKQKLEILKQLYLGNHFLILDEPTSVLTPSEADEVLGHVHKMTKAGDLTVLMITHKFREVRAFADSVTVLRRGKRVGTGRVADLSNDDMAAMMMGQAEMATPLARSGDTGRTVLSLDHAKAVDRSGTKEISIDALGVRSGEIVGLAGISGNGQVELMEMLTGQRSLLSGSIRVEGTAYHATRSEARQHKVRYLPEEPLLNASAPHMSVADNLALRSFDEDRRLFLDRKGIMQRANALIDDFDIRTQGPRAPIRDLSGGNVQRAALARELSGDVTLLIVSNPCFGLDFSAARAIRDRIMEARNKGAAVLLISEDLDEILELSDRVAVISEGRIAFETPVADADPKALGHFMAGHA
nr:ABC transporter ATP-binding protein [uncultured Cohaesibacter sp.]